MNQEINLAQMQPIVYQQLQRSFEHGRIAHAYLFEGEKGIGKHEVGIWLAQHLFCTPNERQSALWKMQQLSADRKERTSRCFGY